MDIWNGVEFAKGLHTGRIYRITNNHVWNISIQTDSGIDIGLKDNYKPSTESAYVEQLKAKAKKLYGEIKDGDRFWIDENLGEVSMYDCEDGFSYWKEEDLLYFGNYAIYSKGKWAKKVEIIKVDGDWIHFDDTYLSIRFSFPKKAVTEPRTAATHLAKCLEDYLNKSQ